MSIVPMLNLSFRRSTNPLSSLNPFLFALCYLVQPAGLKYYMEETEKKHRFGKGLFPFYLSEPKTSSDKCVAVPVLY